MVGADESTELCRPQIWSIFCVAKRRNRSPTELDRDQRDQIWRNFATVEKKILVGILYWANLEPTLALLKCNWQIFVALNGQILKKSCHPVTLIWIVLKTCVASHLT